jgi:hypothetical protein
MCGSSAESVWLCASQQRGGTCRITFVHSKDLHRATGCGSIHAVAELTVCGCVRASSVAACVGSRSSSIVHSRDLQRVCQHKCGSSAESVLCVSAAAVTVVK